MTKHVPGIKATPFAGVRVTHRSTLAFDEVRSRLRSRLGQVTVPEIARLSTEAGSAQEFEERMRPLLGSSGFVLMAEMDHGAWMHRVGIHRRLVRWIFGNPTIAATMLRHDATAGLFVPVELLIDEAVPASGCTVTYVRPSSLIAVGDNRELLLAAQALDAKVEALLASSGI